MVAVQKLLERVLNLLLQKYSLPPHTFQEVVSDLLLIDVLEYFQSQFVSP